MDLDAFVTEHSSEWQRLQTLLRRKRRALTAADVDDLVVLYRRTAAHLSVVQSRSPDPVLVAWLSRLVLDARAKLTPSTGASWASFVRFWVSSFPGEVYRARRWIVGVTAANLALIAVLIVVFLDPQRQLTLVPQEQIDALVEQDFVAYYSQGAPQNFSFAVWTNNAWVCAICLAAGVIILPAIYILWNNAFNVGLVGGIMIGHGRADTFFGLITVHGLLELTCVFVAGGVGLRVAWAWLAPGRYLTRGQSVARAGRSAIVVALGLVPVLAVSGFVEGFVTPSLLPTVVKLALGATVWLAFLAYVVIGGVHADRAGQLADLDEIDREALAPTV
ncbi:stage II sporulation protein M [Luedemannella flava]|uniref:Stage II sporulation protein M n=1 Tax=Luedemannella flava TaxID=349316 RepID=A0ABP4YJT3_9ACTN